MDRGIMLAPVAEWRPDQLVAGQPPAREMMMGRRREMIGIVEKTEWPELVGQPYYSSAQTILRQRPGVQIVDLAPLQALPYGWPSDFNRVCIKVNTYTMTVYGDESYPYPQSG